MTRGVSSHSVLLLYVFFDSCNFPVLFQVENIMSNHRLLTSVQWPDSQGLFLIIIIPRKGSLSLLSSSIVKLSEGGFHLVLTRKQRQMKHLGMMINGKSPRPETKVYAKPTDTGLLPHHQSHVNEKYKLSLLRIMLNLAFKVSSNWMFFHREYECQKKAFVWGNTFINMWRDISNQNSAIT